MSQATMKCDYFVSKYGIESAVPFKDDVVSRS